MLSLVPITVSIAVSIIVLVAIFSIFPQLMGSFKCPKIVGDTDNDYVLDAGENWTGDDAEEAWSVSCNNLKVQTTVVPVLITLAVVIAAILIVTRLFGAGQQ